MGELSEYPVREDLQTVTRAMDAALDQIDDAPDEWLEEAGRRAIERLEW